jgi:hypothetical protein
LIKLSDLQIFLETFVLTTVSFLIPLLIGHPQWIVGIIINTLIVRSALTLKGWKIFPTVLFPSLGALLRGILFGPFTVYLSYFIPFIWFGNLILSFSSRLLFKKSIILRVIVPSVAKAGVLFLAAVFLVSTDIVPDIFLTSMGLIQFITATSGTTFALLSLTIKKKEV